MNQVIKNEDSIEDLPRFGSALYNFAFSEEEKRQKILKKWKRLNKYFVLPLYRIGLLPLLGVGRIFLILKTIGRITGKIRRTPLEYHWIEKIMTIFSGRGENSGWIKNIRANPEGVWVKHGFHNFKARVEFVSNNEEKLKIVKWYVSKHPKPAKMLFGWDSKIDDPETSNFTKLLALITIMRLHKD
jgi:deazaflavin-dependent oxidoreductase (nitroreductase family)